MTGGIHIEGGGWGVSWDEDDIILTSYTFYLHILYYYNGCMDTVMCVYY